MSDLALGVRGDDLRPGLLALGIGGAGPLHLGEEGRQAVVVVLGPALEGMIVALGALDANAAEELGRRLHQFLRRAGDAVVVRRGVGEGVALRREQLPHDLVEWRVLFDLLAHPFPVRFGAFGLQGPPAVAQHVEPLQRPEVGVLGPLQQVVDQLGPLVRGGVGQELPGLVRRGQGTADVEVGPAQELRVVAQVRRLNVQQLVLGVDVPVHVVVLGGIGPGEAGLRFQDMSRRTDCISSR